MGMSMQTILPCSEEYAISLLGQSFPPVYAFLGVAHALALRPEDSWSQSHLEEVINHGISRSTPEHIQWDQMHEVLFHGWAALVQEHSAESRWQELQHSVISMWPKHVMKPPRPMNPLVHGNETPEEGPYFYEEERPVHCLTVCRPHWPNKTLTVTDELSQMPAHVVQRLVAALWDEAPAATVCYEARSEACLPVLLMDVVTCKTVDKCLVLVKQLCIRAAWVESVPKEDELLQLFSVKPRSCMVNGVRHVSGCTAVANGDVVEAFEAMQLTARHDDAHMPTGPECDRLEVDLCVTEGKGEMPSGASLAVPKEARMENLQVHKCHESGIGSQVAAHSTSFPRPVWPVFRPGWKSSLPRPRLPCKSTSMSLRMSLPEQCLASQYAKGPGLI